MLAVTWQPAFCQLHARKPECGSQTSDRFDATHFTLHGLWPQPRAKEYCGVSAALRDLDRPDFVGSTAACGADGCDPGSAG